MAHLTKTFSDITFETIDWAVYNYFDKKFPLIIDGRKVPVVFASPERWAQIQRDAFLKDEKGQLMLPAIAIRRGSPEINPNRYVPKRPETDIKVKVPVLTPEGEQKIIDGNPVYEVHRISYPRFIKMNYSVVIWASYYVDINEIQQRYLWEGIDHVFTHEGWWFTGTIQSINEASNTEDHTKQERMQKVEYTINIDGYISDTRSFKKEQTISTVVWGYGLHIDDEKNPEYTNKPYHFSDPEPEIPVR